MVGLEGVKEEFQSLLEASYYDALEVERGGEPRKSTMHMIFEGPSGTGKTMVAEEIGKLYFALGLVPTPNFKKVERADLIDQYQGGTPDKVRRVFYGDESKGIKPGKGGVIFIDEAYGLMQGDKDQYGQEAVTTLLTLLEDNRDDTVVILAGYDDGEQNMTNLMAANPGLKSRFPRTITFPSYNSRERFDIAQGAFAEAGFTLGDAKTRKQISSELSSGIRQTGDGNARDVRNLVDSIITEHKRRIGRRKRVETDFAPSQRELKTITVDDVRAGVGAYVRGARK